MATMFPLLLAPSIKDYLWGGRRLADEFGYPCKEKAAEAWVLSCHKEGPSIVRGGPLDGRPLPQVLEEWGPAALGERAAAFPYFPLLIKLIDARDRLSIQVHPDDAYALRTEGEYGKTEMWYVVDCGPDAALRVGFDGPVTREQYAEHVERGTLPELLAKARVHPGDTFFVPAGTVHTIEGSVLIAEIQQASDITYRIYDWDRVGPDGRKRELQTDLAANAIDFASGTSFDVTAAPERNRFVTLKKCPYFTTNLLLLDGRIERNHVGRDSFAVYMMLDGRMTLSWDKGTETVDRGETVLLPACIEEIGLEGRGKLLEIYID